MWNDDERVPCHFESWRYTTISELCFSAGSSGRRIRRLSGSEPRKCAPGRAGNLSKLCFFLKITSHPTERLLFGAEIHSKIIFFFVESTNNCLTNHTYVWKCWKPYYMYTDDCECGCIILVDHFSGCGNAENHIQVQQLDIESSDNCAIKSFLHMERVKTGKKLILFLFHK